MYRGSTIVLSLSVAGFFFASCGGGPNESDLQQNLNALSTTKATYAVQAQGSFQELGLEVKAGQKILISSTGSVTVGLIDASDQANPRLKYYDANGGDHYGYDAATSRWVLVVSSLNFNVGFQVGQTNVRNRLANGTVEAFAITPQNQSYGPMCSTIKRAVKAPDQFGADFLMGQPIYFVEPRRCVAPAKHGALIMKIVPPGKNPIEIDPILVGKNFEQTPYIAPTDGSLYFAVNDALFLDDNQGQFIVTAEIVP